MIKQVNVKVCDICKQEDKKCKTIHYPVKFSTDQRDGYPCTSYYEMKWLDVCPLCLETISKVKGYHPSTELPYVNNVYSVIIEENEEVTETPSEDVGE